MFKIISSNMDFGLIKSTVLASIIITFFAESNCSILTLDSIDCVAGKKLCPNKTCSISLSRNKQYLVNIGCFIPIPLYNVEVKMQRKRGESFDNLLSGKENMCEVVRLKSRSQLMARVAEGIRQYVSNFKCPFQGNVVAKDLPISLRFVPGFLPMSLYRIQVYARDGNELMMGIDLNMTIGKKKNVPKNKNKN